MQLGAIPMKRHLTTLFTLAVLLLPSSAIASPVPSAPSDPMQTTATATLHLMRNENYLYLKATSFVPICNVSYVFPPEYQYQTPVFIEILNDTTTALISYTIINDTEAPNKLVVFTLSNLTEHQTVMIHFNSWALVNPTDFKDLPRYVRFPRLRDLPRDTWQWLTPSPVVQSRSITIRHTARQLAHGTTNLLRYADRVVWFTHHHRELFYALQLRLGTLKGQDAKTVLRRSGDCPGRSHLAAALFRAQGVPARSVMVSQHDPYWVQMHYMVEYYCPGIGWILTQAHGGKTPVVQDNDLILRICGPTDERHTVHDYVFPKMTGEEQWLWIDSHQVKPLYTEAMDASRQTLFLPGNQTTDPATAAYAFSLTQMVFRRYQPLLGANLTGENLQHYNNATIAQHSALLSFPTDLADYLSLMSLAYQEYQQIT